MTEAAGAQITPQHQSGTGDYKVLIVDDSAVIRGLVGRWLRSEPGVSVVATAGNGITALAALDTHEIDVVVLDIEMPEMDGMTALPKMLRKSPDLKVIMSSTLTDHGAAVTLRALSLGAADYIPKPSTTLGLQSSDDFRKQLVDKVKALGAARHGQAKVRTKPQPKDAAEGSNLFAGKSVDFRPVPAGFRPKIVAVGSSTGGPQALTGFFRDLKGPLSVPVVVTQHMPPTFTKLLANHIAQSTGANMTEAVEGETLEKGHIYLAPGDYHMTVAEESGAKVVRLNQEPQENFCRPAVDVMLRSLAKVYGGRVLTVILTGMGFDGKKGGEIATNNGGVIIAQDEGTSVVWGMPGAVATSGLCSAVLPLEDIAPAVTRMVAGEAL